MVGEKWPAASYNSSLKGTFVQPKPVREATKLQEMGIENNDNNRWPDALGAPNRIVGSMQRLHNIQYTYFTSPDGRVSSRAIKMRDMWARAG